MKLPFLVFNFNFAATRHNAFKFSVYSLKNINYECEHSYATENVYNTARECHQDFKNFLRSLMCKNFVH